MLSAVPPTYASIAIARLRRQDIRGLVALAPWCRPLSSQRPLPA